MTLSSMASFDEKTKIFCGGRLANIYHPDVPLGQVLIYQCLKFPDKVIQIFAEDGTKVTCDELSRSSMKVASYLKKNLGTNFGDVVGFCCRNSKFSTPALFGCIFMGLPISPVEPSFDVDAIVKIFAKTQPKFLFCDVEHLEKIQVVLKALQSKAKVLTLNRHVELMSVCRIIEESTSSLDDIPLKFDLPAEKICVAILTSSGTTGEPKFARISHAQALQSFYAFNGFIDETLLLNFGELFWIAGFTCMIHCVLNQHTRLITNIPFTPKAVVHLIERFKVTQMTLTPAGIKAIAEYLEQHSGDLSSLKLLVTGAWFLSEDTVRQIESKMPNGRVEYEYGMTEIGAITHNLLSDPPTSVGTLAPNVEAKILMATGDYGGVGDVGEILLRVPFNIIDYLNDEEKSRELFEKNSFIRTGDMGYFDENFNLFICGRKKFMIRCRNRLVSPVPIEESIVSLSGVEKVCVTALPVSDSYEAPCAVIERKVGSDTSEEDVHEAVASLDEVNHLKGGVFFVDKLPMTPTGKLNRNLIEKMAVSLSRKG